MQLVCLLVFLALYLNFWFTASHIEGKQNTLADALSRDNMNFFLLTGPSGFMRTTLNSQRTGYPAGTESVLDIHILDSVIQHY